ncbi:hypothetical protein OG921_03060 [Aldersonia sp. NBC_00410]|uniref:hypothetical protein n=1 Tax=Aldersonia sp. NBC_00410 TaxID=2975954 RepID=UPI00225424D3|nr:hypothetical protein [Aldersonia sp. NBC_00410]MCX5042171.1 hypothetical protein [Aldersonia sp. NBC_00410]
MADPQVTYLADHSLLLALPAVGPAILIAGVVVWLAVRDRRRRGEDGDDPEYTDDFDEGNDEHT